ncbi:MAG: hypothetical protein HOW97_01725 [Catenulispora sp.]|nr:hypothetical protein [Catenulispora sp.]
MGRQIPGHRGDVTVEHVTVPPRQPAAPPQPARTREPSAREAQLQAARQAAEGDQVVEIMAAAAFDGLTLWYPETGNWLVVDGTVETDYGSNPLSLPHRPMTTIPIRVPVGTRSWTVPANTTVVLRIRTVSE